MNKGSVCRLQQLSDSNLGVRGSPGAIVAATCAARRWACGEVRVACGASRGQASHRFLGDQHDLDGFAFIHRFVGLCGLLQRHHCIKHQAGVDGAVQDVL